MSSPDDTYDEKYRCTCIALMIIYQPLSWNNFADCFSTCVEVVKDASSKLCPQCECKYESRNTTTIKVNQDIFKRKIKPLIISNIGFMVCTHNFKDHITL